MAAKRKRLRAPATRSGFTAVLKEIERQKRALVEALMGDGDSVKQQLAELRAYMHARFDKMEAILRDFTDRGME